MTTTAQSTIDALEEAKMGFEDILVVEPAAMKDRIARHQLRKIKPLLAKISKERVSGKAGNSNR